MANPNELVSKRFINLDRHLSQRFLETKVLNTVTGESVTTRVRVGPENESKTHAEISDEEMARRDKDLDENGRTEGKPIDYDMRDPKHPETNLVTGEQVLVDDHLEMVKAPTSQPADLAE
jgi:hypothetical protein